MADNKNIGNVIGGHKAALKNPNVSEGAKQDSRAAVEGLQDGDYEPQESSKNEGNVIGGHKATLKNPNVSEAAKEHSRQVLEDKDAL